MGRAVLVAVVVLFGALFFSDKATPSLVLSNTVQTEDAECRAVNERISLVYQRLINERAPVLFSDNESWRPYQEYRRQIVTETARLARGYYWNPQYVRAPDERAPLGYVRVSRAHERPDVGRPPVARTMLATVFGPQEQQRLLNELRSMLDEFLEQFRQGMLETGYIYLPVCRYTLTVTDQELLWQHRLLGIFAGDKAEGALLDFRIPKSALLPFTRTRVERGEPKELLLR